MTTEGGFFWIASVSVWPSSFESIRELEHGKHILRKSLMLVFYTELSLLKPLRFFPGGGR